MRRTLGHPPAAAARAEPAPFAGKRHQPLGVAVPALETREAACPGAAGQEVTKLLLDERGQAALGMLGGAKERRKVLAHDAMEHGVLGRARAVRVRRRGSRRGRGRHAERHERGERSAPRCEYLRRRERRSRNVPELTPPCRR